MPLYYFHIEHGFKTLDDHGTELPDKHAAWKEATTICGDMMRDIDGRFQPGKPLTIVLEDEFRDPLYELKVLGKSKVGPG